MSILCPCGTCGGKSDESGTGCLLCLGLVAYYVWDWLLIMSGTVCSTCLGLVAYYVWDWLLIMSGTGCLLCLGLVAQHVMSGGYLVLNDALDLSRITALSPGIHHEGRLSG